MLKKREHPSAAPQAQRTGKDARPLGAALATSATNRARKARGSRGRTNPGKQKTVTSRQRAQENCASVTL